MRAYVENKLSHDKYICCFAYIEIYSYLYIYK